jgi:hypothetical protein
VVNAWTSSLYRFDQAVVAASPIGLRPPLGFYGLSQCLEDHLANMWIDKVTTQRIDG